ncbi:hypothetical protein Droror1_Dr00021637 [Drosera rotundifolia]
MKKHIMGQGRSRFRLMLIGGTTKHELNSSFFTLKALGADKSCYEIITSKCYAAPPSHAHSSPYAIAQRNPPTQKKKKKKKKKTQTQLKGKWKKGKSKQI